jgi:hypothetical protein
MDTKVTRIQVTFNKDELFQMLSMLHDSTSHWRKHLVMAEQDPEYHLKPEGCKAVLANSEKMYAEVQELYNKHFN